MARVVIDASVLIALYDDKDKHHGWALEFMNATLEDDLLISAVTYAEVLVRPARYGTLARFRTDIAGLTLTVEPLVLEDAIQLAEVRAEHRISMPDAIVLHTALRTDSAVATCDHRLADAAQAMNRTVYRIAK